jgi:hypothetical protein
LEKEMDGMKAVEEALKLLLEAKADFSRKGFDLVWDISISVAEELPPDLQAVADGKKED